MSGALEARIAAGLSTPMAQPIRDFAGWLAEEAGAMAVLFYGSNLRTGLLDGVLDFYVLLPGGPERGIWPRVSYHEREHEGRILRAKVATMRMATFHEAAAGRRLDTTIWARFVQPAALAWSAGPDAQRQITEALAAAVLTAARLAAALGPAAGVEEDYWRALFSATYRAEFRVEKAGREESILAVNRTHFTGLLPLALAAMGLAPDEGGKEERRDWLAPRLDRRETARILRWWHLRRLMGKPYNLLRLLRASTTFDGAARYAAWKVERHTGVKVELTPWREKHPVLAAPGVLWQVWRARGKAS